MRQYRFLDRRSFLLALVALCGCGKNEAPSVAKEAGSLPQAGPRAAGARQLSAGAEQGTNVPRVAVLVFGPRDSGGAGGPSSAVTLFRNRMAELGYLEGKTVVLEERYADGDSQRLTQLAREVVDGRPDVIVAIAAAATAAVHQATTTIPIVMAHAGNPVGSGLVQSLAHPGGNVTGTTSMVPDLGVKQVDILREMLPRLTKLAVLANPTNAATVPLLENVRDGARRFGVSLVVAEVAREEDFSRAFDQIRRARPDALLVMMEPFIGANQARLLDFVATNRLAASYDVGRELVRAGGLVSYGPVLQNHYALVADYVDRILKGASPGDLPVQQPTQFALVINLKTAKALGLAIPQSLLVRADEVIR